MRLRGVTLVISMETDMNKLPLFMLERVKSGVEIWHKETRNQPHVDILIRTILSQYKYLVE